MEANNVNQGLSPMNKPLIEMENITKRFKVRDGSMFTALDRVSLQVGYGEFFSIIGPSGCGKTTLLKIIDGLVPTDEGSVIIQGKEISTPGPDRAVVFQDFALMPWATTLKNVAFPLEIKGSPATEVSTLASKYIELVGLGDFADHYPHELSGGMQQRVGLARALVAEPTILLMDEPFGSLDAQTRRELQNELLTIWKASGQGTVVFVTHSMDEAVYLSDKIVIMSTRPGRIHEELIIDLPRPRSEATRKDSKYVELVEYVWNVLKILAHPDEPPIKSDTQ